MWHCFAYIISVASTAIIYVSCNVSGTLRKLYVVLTTELVTSQVHFHDSTRAVEFSKTFSLIHYVPL